MPLPPLYLIRHVGPLDPSDPVADYLRTGRSIKDGLVSLLGSSWDWHGKRALDFGCGAGRVLRHFVAEAQDGAELHGCDVHAPSIAWLREQVSPPMHVFVNGKDPPLPFDDGYFDIIWAASIFTHLAEGWSDWLLEMHRLLTPDGLLIASFLGAGMSEAVAGEPWEEDRIGMNVLGFGSKWSNNHVLHSPWWIHAHWGRAFEILELRTHGFAHEPGGGHGVVLMRRRAAALSPADLERVEPDPRELDALRHNVHQLRRYLRAHYRGRQAEAEELKQQRDGLRAALEALRSSRTWRLTQPLRSMGEMVHRLRSADGRSRQLSSRPPD